MANGRFDQRITVVSTGRTAIAHGDWRLDQQDQDIYFSKDFLVVADGFGKLILDFDQRRGGAIAILPIRRSLRGIQIGLDPRSNRQSCNGRYPNNLNQLKIKQGGTGVMPIRGTRGRDAGALKKRPSLRFCSVKQQRSCSTKADGF